jgi:PIN domain nuclease of toxin-antitoxin system
LRLLLDTHIALWLLYRDDRLPAAARTLFDMAENELVVSVASVWEIAIKHQLDRGTRNDWMPVSGETARLDLEVAGIVLLPITAVHVVQAGILPRHHSDPFDRMLVAQALVEPMRLVTADRALAAYGEIVILV